MPSALLGYAPGMEHHQPILGTLGGHGRQVKREITKHLHCPGQSLFFLQKSYRPLLSSCKEVCLWVAAVHRRPRYEHVINRSAGMGEVDFLRNLYRVLHLSVHEVDTEVGALRCSPPPQYLTGHSIDLENLVKETLYILGPSVAIGTVH